jgi:putative endonuclease
MQGKRALAGQSTTAVGGRAETVAAEYLQARGFVFITQNWRQKDCEIDLVMGKNQTIHFVEVKYRSSSASGQGLEYITPRKLQQMHYAARRWLQLHKWYGASVLSAIEVSGPEFQVTGFVETIERDY